MSNVEDGEWRYVVWYANDLEIKLAKEVLGEGH